MFITVLLVVCLDLSNPGTCVSEPVVDSAQDSITMSACLGVEGMESAKEFWEHHPLYHTWQFKGWRCQIGNKKPPERGGA
jgi:hypothetical protein